MRGKAREREEHKERDGVSEGSCNISTGAVIEAASRVVHEGIITHKHRNGTQASTRTKTRTTGISQALSLDFFVF